MLLKEVKQIRIEKTQVKFSSIDCRKKKTGLKEEEEDL